MSTSEIQEKVRERYAAAATSADPSCCDADCCSADAFDTADSGNFGSWMYQADEFSEIPDGAALAAL